jgi:hypothetical protein
LRIVRRAMRQGRIMRSRDVLNAIPIMIGQNARK